MEREPQFKDRVRLPDDRREGEIVAMAQTVKGWCIWVRPDGDTKASLWKGRAADVELIKAAGDGGSL
jgi:hypothetical protein